MAESDVGAVDVGDRAVSSGKVSLAALTALGIGSMIGGGIFGLPQQMARAAAPGPLIIGWFITGVGMLMLAFVYQRLAISRPEINAGVYGYARAGFGDLVGFSSAWGYWLSAWIGNVGYLVLLMASLGVFLPGFGDGNTALAIGVASVIMWMYHVLILRGIREAAIINFIEVFSPDAFVEGEDDQGCGGDRGDGSGIEGDVLEGLEVLDQGVGPLGGSPH